MMDNVNKDLEAGGHEDENKEDEEKEEGELEEGELEDDDDDEEMEQEPPAQEANIAKVLVAETLQEQKIKDGESKEKPILVDDGKAEYTKDRKKEDKDKHEDKKRKHSEEEGGDKKKKKKKKRKHVSSEEDDVVVPEGGRKMKFPIKMNFDAMGFDAMLQQEMFLRGRSPPPGMVPLAPNPLLFRRPGSDFESDYSSSGDELHNRRRRRHRRSRSRSPSRKNEAICMFYMQGSCQKVQCSHKGKGCPYSHNIQPQRKMELCKFYMMDCCAKKDKCLYMHKDFPCKFYHTGIKCRLKEKCKFSHDPLTDPGRVILLKHIELAPKDILGDFPRLTKDAAHLVVFITERHRLGEPLHMDDIDQLPLKDLQGRGFKYVDKAIKALAKKREEEGEEEEPEQPSSRQDKSDKKSSRSQESSRKDRGPRTPSKNKADKSPPDKSSSDRSSRTRAQDFWKDEKEEVNGKSKRDRKSSGSEKESKPAPRGLAGFMSRISDRMDEPSPKKSEPSPNEKSPRKSTGTSSKEEKAKKVSKESKESKMNKERDNKDSEESKDSKDNKDEKDQEVKENKPRGVSALMGGLMARLQPKQRELFQRMNQQLGMTSDEVEATEEGQEDQAGGDTTNDPPDNNWYSSDEEGDQTQKVLLQHTNKIKHEDTGETQLSNPQSQQASSITPTKPDIESANVDRTPPSSEFSSPGQQKQQSEISSPPTENKKASSFTGIDFSNIKISSDLANVLSRLQNQSGPPPVKRSESIPSAKKVKRRDSRESISSPRGSVDSKDSREDWRPIRDPRHVATAVSDLRLDRDSRSDHNPRSDRNPRSDHDRRFERDPRQATEMMMDPKQQNPWDSQHDPWNSRDSLSDSDAPRSKRDPRFSTESKDSQDYSRDHLMNNPTSRDPRQRSSDVDLRVLPGDNPKPRSIPRDTDMRHGADSIYDVDLRQLNLPNMYNRQDEEEPSGLPFKVPQHTPAKEIDGSIASHPAIFYKVVKVSIPKPNFSRLKINEDDSRTFDDPRIRRMLRRNSTEDSEGRSPREPTRYRLSSEGPLSPTYDRDQGKTEPRGDVDSRDPRMAMASLSRDPRAEACSDQRVNAISNEPRVGSRIDPRADSRDPRAASGMEMRMDPRMGGGMYGGTNNMMDGGMMQYGNMGQGPMNM
ncbi:unnamed protein product, partial [Meganyctiphanes norvegica]